MIWFQLGMLWGPQVGAAGYRIDFGILDEANPGRFLCGIECDGVAYHSSETARDRDRLRQQVLEFRVCVTFEFAVKAVAQYYSRRKQRPGLITNLGAR